MVKLVAASFSFYISELTHIGVEGHICWGDWLLEIGQTSCWRSGVPLVSFANIFSENQSLLFLEITIFICFILDLLLHLRRWSLILDCTHCEAFRPWLSFHTLMAHGPWVVSYMPRLLKSHKYTTTSWFIFWNNEIITYR